ncbi:SLN1 [Candida pseudojiufengensis]|uniref:SLN1 n=1 Tax=Candida pseudojiufengensis TaxID=497109 RepID=UPI0022258D0A|nr:SLN1 [Candida pseudojiufengensis]KAI5960976.1 SLN1 [Candida pseudojiufengensis]
MKFKRLKIGIRPQLIGLVCFASLLSLLILGLVTGIYFSDNLKSLRSERLAVISQLKALQVGQAMGFIDLTIGSLSTVDTVVKPLIQASSGNSSSEIYDEVQDLFNQYMSTDNLISARLYDKDLNLVTTSLNEPVQLSNETKSKLYPIPNGGPLTRMVDEYSRDGFYYSGPVSNETVNQNTTKFYMGVTTTITSSIDNNDTIVGYISVIASADALFTALNVSTNDYWTLAVTPVFNDNSTDYDDNMHISDIKGFEAVFPNKGGIIQAGKYYPIGSSSLIGPAFKSNDTDGVTTNVRSVTKVRLATSYYRVRYSNWMWLIMTAQTSKTFNAPVTKLKKIIIGVTFGIGFFMCVLTLFLAIWFIRPITRLKVATESITQYKKEQIISEKKEKNNGEYDNDLDKYPGGSKRSSVHTISTNGSGSVHSTGIRLPSRIPRSKALFKDELTELSEAFNIMTEELEKQYMHLEDRVRVRTKELEASKIEAEAANEAKTVFIANISHELRTPLNGILGMASIAMEEEDQTRMKESLKLIYRSGELLLHILTELLTYSKNTLNRSKLEKSNFQILEIVYQIHSIFNKLALDQRVNFKISVKPNFFRKLILYGDSNRIIQIIMNLVSNSLKFTPIDGFVDVNFKLIGEYDYEKSEACNFEKVICVDNDYYGNENYDENPSRPIAPRYGTNMSLIRRNSRQHSQNDKTSVKRSSKYEIQEPQQQPHDAYYNDNDDNISITTLSTQQYEKVIFNQQFQNQNQNQNREFDKLTPLSPRTSFDDSSDTKNLSSSSDDGKGSNSSIKLQQQQQQEQDDDEIQSELSNYILPQAKGFKSHPSMNKKEENEGDKSFKIKNIYKPKTWVIQIEVKDTGSGIEPAFQEKVFEPFVQGDQTLSRSYGGTGLGLSICRQLARMMKGTLTLKSKIGKGSIFTLTLPLPQTGEMMMSSKDLEEFCDDEFNPSAKINRKVVFNDEVETVGTKPSRNTETKSMDSAIYAKSSTGTARHSTDNNCELENNNNIENNNNTNDIIISQREINDNDEEKMPIALTTVTTTPTTTTKILKTPTTTTTEVTTLTKTVTTSPNSNLEEISSDLIESQLQPKPTNGIHTKVSQLKSSNQSNNLNKELHKGSMSSTKTTSTTATYNSTSTTKTNSSSSSSTSTIQQQQYSDELKNIKILVAEDNQVNQEVIKRMLKLEGFSNLTLVTNGKEAVEIIKNSIPSEISSSISPQEEQFDLIFMDVQMPIMDGITAVKIIRNQLQFKNLIIALTAFADESNVKECYNCGMNGFLAKPIKRNFLKKVFIEFQQQLRQQQLNRKQQQQLE